MRKYCFFMVVVCVLACVFNNSEVYAKNTEDLKEVMVIDSFTGERLNPINDFSLSPEKLMFVYNEKSFQFNLDRLKDETVESFTITRYFGLKDDLSCCVAEFKDSYCIRVSNMNESCINQKKDRNTNFTIIYAKEAEKYLPEIRDFFLHRVTNNRDMIKSAQYDLHVLASVTTAPFLYSAGSSEGWCTSTSLGYDYYKITSMAYSITYNWPSDGITLWSDVMNNTIAYASPVYPPAGYTTVSDLWAIENELGAFEAETTVTAVLHVIPILWSIYDTTNMRGVHE